MQFGDPVCACMRQALKEVLQGHDVRFHDNATYVAMEGPVFSTRAESQLYRSWGADVIGMTAIPEAKLAREAEMCYAVLALSTDYDCWHQSEEEVSVEAVLEVIRQNVTVAQQAIIGLAEGFPPPGDCNCQRALEGALLTAVDSIPDQTRQRLELLAGRLFR